ncbi:MAG: flagellar protein [Spirochaetaceae bacterium]|nr:MAG: flagellar protein [Spirochaetaceae bacterium]
MKRFLVVLVVMLFACAVSGIAQEASADDPKVLIDFGSLEGTDVDFGAQAGSSISQEERDQMKVSLEIGTPGDEESLKKNRWEADLASSAQVGDNERLTYVAAAASQSKGTVLGVRCHFPAGAFNSYAIIRPPFEIPAYAGEDGTQFDGKGILTNVGQIKYIELQVSGRNYPHGIAIILQDQSGEDRIIFVDYLRFDGWKTLVWRNPNYEERSENRDLRPLPLYPLSQPFVKFKGFILYRDGSNVGGDFVTYIKDIKVAFDAAIRKGEEDIADDDVWGILKERQARRQAAELRRLGNLQVLRFIDEQNHYTGRPPVDETQPSQ